VEGSVRPAGEGSRSGLVVLAPRLLGLLGILGLPRTPSPGTADRIDTAGREAGRAWAAAPRRLVLLLEGVAFDLRPREEVGSAGLQHYPAVVPPFLFGIRLPFSMTVGVCGTVWCENDGRMSFQCFSFFYSRVTLVTGTG
jgi:hypothetical protein